MEIKIIGSTNNITTKEKALAFASNCGAVCYSKEGFNELSLEKNQRILNRLLDSAHQSPFDQISFNLEFNNIPKMGAMVLNNERPYTTSEKSARYKKMKLTGSEQELYDKWMNIFDRKISKQYPSLGEIKIKKLAQENARYLSSVFTPTHMVHELSLRQVNYLVHWFNDFNVTEKNTPFNIKLKQFMKDFNKGIVNDLKLFENRLDPRIKKRELSIFSKRDSFPTEFGENYSVSYEGTFAQLAQAHRHRTLDYQITNISSAIEEPKFFVPPIIKNNSTLTKNWLKDMNSVQKNFPQGTLINIHETGNYRDFISKATERLCEHAQWEIMNQTKETLSKYHENTTSPYIKNELSHYLNGPKCTFPGVKCSEPGPFGKKLGLERTV